MAEPDIHSSDTDRGAWRGNDRWSLVALFIAFCLLALLGGMTVGTSSTGASCPAPMMTSAQAEFAPSSLLLGLGEEATVDVMVHGAQDLCGYELEITFNPSVIEVLDLDPSRVGVNVLPGGILSPYYAPTNVCSNISGTISLAVARIGGNPANGDGCLASIRIRGKSVGNANMAFSTVFLADSNSLPIASGAVVPSYVVHDGPTSTATDGPSPTPTEAVTVGPSPTPSHTPTPTSTLSPTPTTTGQAPSVTPTPYFYLSPQILDLEPGEQRTVEIRTSWVDELAGVQVELSWNPTLVRVIDALPGEVGIQIEPGDLFQGLYVIHLPNNNVVDNTLGELIYFLSLGASPDRASGAWTVGTITFEGLMQGTSTLSFDHENTLMSHPDWGNIWCGWQDGELRVGEPTPTPTPTSNETVPATTATPTLDATIPAEPTPTATLTGMEPRIYMPLIFKDAAA